VNRESLIEEDGFIYSRFTIHDSRLLTIYGFSRVRQRNEGCQTGRLARARKKLEVPGY
jgi:hypothetical protein